MSLDRYMRALTGLHSTDGASPKTTAEALAMALDICRVSGVIPRKTDPSDPRKLLAVLGDRIAPLGYPPCPVSASGVRIYRAWMALQLAYRVLNEEQAYTDAMCAAEEVLGGPKYFKHYKEI